MSPRLSVEEALSLLETAGRLARGLKEGAPTIPEVVRDLKGLGEVLEAFRGEAKRYERLSGEMSATLGGFLRRLEGEMQGFVADTRREVSEALSRVVNPLVPATTLAVLSSLFAVGFLVLSSVHSAGWVSALPYLGRPSWAGRGLVVEGLAPIMGACGRPSPSSDFPLQTSPCRRFGVEWSDPGGAVADLNPRGFYLPPKSSFRTAKGPLLRPPGGGPAGARPLR